MGDWPSLTFSLLAKVFAKGKMFWYRLSRILFVKKPRVIRAPIYRNPFLKKHRNLRSKVFLGPIESKKGCFMLKRPKVCFYVASYKKSTFKWGSSWKILFKNKKGFFINVKKIYPCVWSEAMKSLSNKMVLKWKAWAIFIWFIASLIICVEINFKNL